MSQPDSQVLDNLFHQEATDKALRAFTSSEYLFLNDNQQGNFSAGMIRFDTQPMAGAFWVPSDSWLAIPLTVESSVGGGSALTEGSAVAFKNSVLDLITGVQITTASGQSIVNDQQSVSYINNLRLLLESSIDSMETNQADIQFFKQIGTNLQYPVATGAFSYGMTGTLAGNDPQRFVYAATGPTSPVLNPNPLFNEGFAQRIKLFKQGASSFTAGRFNMVVTIPLKFLHPLFAALDFPLINTRFQFTFTTPVRFNSAAAGIPSSDYPLMVGVGVGGTTSSTNALRMGIGGDTLLGNTTRIYYRRVTFASDANKKVSEMLTRGYSKTLSYTVLDSYPSLIPTITADTTISQLVSSSTVAPLRMWVAFLPRDAEAQNVSPFMPFISRAVFSQTNCLVNSVPYYSNNLILPREHWQVVEEQTISCGSKDNLGAAIGYQDWLQNYRVICIDLSRYKERLVNSSEPVNLILNTSISRMFDPRTGTGTDVNMLVLIERAQVIKFTFSSAETSILIGSAVNV